jgi:hypothetical protein
LDAQKVITYWKSINRQLELDHHNAEVRRIEEQVRERSGGGKSNLDLAYTAEEKAARDQLLRRIFEVYVSLPRPIRWPRSSRTARSCQTCTWRYAATSIIRERRPIRASRGALRLGRHAELRKRAFSVTGGARLWCYGSPRRTIRLPSASWSTGSAGGISAVASSRRRTISDGRGEPPTHSELLDWLATEFVARGWSVKAMHRLIMLSSIYRMADDYNPANTRMDSDNRYLWRMNRRWLEAEEQRDAVLRALGR